MARKPSAYIAPAPFHATTRVRNNISARHAESRALTPKDNFAVGWLVPTDPCQTAYWKIDEKTGDNQIRLNPQVYAVLTKQSDPLSPFAGRKVRFQALFDAVYDHERAHSVYTTRNLKGLADKLRAEKIPWRLCNLFEDCRIEHRWCSDHHTSFKWTTWEPAGLVRVDSPAALLYAFKVLRSDEYARYKKAPRAFLRRVDRKYYYAVRNFHDRIIGAASTEDLIPILKDWLKMFPPDKSGNTPENDEDLGGGGGDLADAIDNSSDSGSSPTDGGDSGDASEGKGSIRDQDDELGAPESDDTESRRDGSFRTGRATSGVGGFEPEKSDTASDIQEKTLAARLAAYMAKAFKIAGNSPVNGPTPSKRLNTRGLIRNDWRNPYRVMRQTEHAKTPHVSLVVDCSGSMGWAYGGITPDDVKVIAGSEDIGYPPDHRTDREVAGFAKPPQILPRGRVNNTSYTRMVDGRELAPNAIDCDRGGRVFARALHLLARKGIITATVYCSRQGGVSHRIELPAKRDRDFGFIFGDSGQEGLAKTLSPTAPAGRSAFKEIAAKSKVVLIWTEGDVTDDPIDRAPLRARGVFTVGLLATLANRQKDIARHFDAAICRTSLFGVASDLAKLLKSGACDRPKVGA